MNTIMQWLLAGLTLLGVPLVWGLFKLNRGKPKYLLGFLILYIVVTFFVPFVGYFYQQAYGNLFIQSLLFLSCIAMLMALYPKYCFKTNADYQDSKPRFDNSAREVIHYPFAAGAFIMAWGIVFVIVLLIFCIVKLGYSTNHALIWQDLYVQLALFCVIGIVVFQLFLRLFPRCPYCHSGLFDFDLRLQPENYRQRHTYLIDSYRILLNILFLRRFNCRYCKAPFTFKKSHSKLSI